MIRQFKSRQFLLFILTGGTAAIVNFTSRIVLNAWLSFSVSIFLAYILGAITAYCLTRTFVFANSQQPISHSIGFFIMINLIAILQTWGLSVALADYILPWLSVNSFKKEIAHGIGVIFPVFSSYIGHKKWTFR